MTPIDETKPSSRSEFGLGALLVGLIAIAYWPVQGFDFINYDDPWYVTKNLHVNAGLSLQSVKWAFTAMHASNWHPLTWISHMLDCQLFGLHACGHHLVNLALHAANTLLLFSLLRRLTGVAWGAWFVAALFAVHPMHVESVAWVSERKDVLSTFFGLLALGTYLTYATHESHGRAFGAYGLALAFFALGLLSKPMLVTWPFVMLLLDWWPLQRFNDSTIQRFNPSRLISLLVEKIPFFVLSAISCALTVMAQTKGGSVAPTKDIDFLQRVANALTAYGWYVWRLFVPADQAVIYPLMPDREIGAVLGGALVVAGLSALAVWQMNRRPWIFFGWFWFLGVLVPVIGLMQVGMQAYADRYTYLSYVGLFLILTWIAAEILSRRPGLANAFRAAAAVILLLCIGATRYQLQFWKDSETLYRRALDVTEYNYIALNNLGFTCFQRDEFDAAIEHCQKALQVAPQYGEAFNTIGLALLSLKKPDEALTNFEQAVRFRPKNCNFRLNLGTALHLLKRYDEAVASYKASLELCPDSEDACYDLGNTYSALGDSTNAMTCFERAIALRPGYADAHLNLGYELGKLGRRDGAKAEFERALAVDTNCVNAHFALGQVADEEGNHAEAIKQWRIYLASKPDHAATLNNLAWLLVSTPDPALRNGAEAVAFAKHACELTDTNTPALYLGTLAAAYAEAGDFSNAVVMAESARDAAKKNSEDELVRKNEAYLALYRAGKTCRDLKADPPK